MRNLCNFVVYLLLLYNFFHSFLVTNLCVFLFLFSRLFSNFVKVTVALFCYVNISFMRDFIFGNEF